MYVCIMLGPMGSDVTGFIYIFEEQVNLILDKKLNKLIINTAEEKYPYILILIFR